MRSAAARPECLCCVCHKDELYGGVAVLFRFKGVTKNADKMKLAVCRKTIDKVLLDV